MEITDAHLRALTAESDGIEGITSWKRVEVEKVSINTELLKELHPKEYAECVEQGADTEVLKVERAAGYIDGQ